MYTQKRMKCASPGRFHQVPKFPASGVWFNAVSHPGTKCRGRLVSANICVTEKSAQLILLPNYHNYLRAASTRRNCAIPSDCLESPLGFSVTTSVFLEIRKSVMSRKER